MTARVRVEDASNECIEYQNDAVNRGGLEKSYKRPIDQLEGQGTLENSAVIGQNLVGNSA
jgi:hypothetical protein